MDDSDADELGFRRRLVEYKRFRLTAGLPEVKVKVYCRSIRVNQATTSIFDLSPSEKLQLVEDLWDDLAVTPEAIPVHDWQKEELDRRKANLMKNPASGLTWGKVKHRVRNRQDG
jgi:putative addiction module component (TIGR02574 family)